jgi:hypothetical protein
MTTPCCLGQKFIAGNKGQKKSKEDHPKLFIIHFNSDEFIILNQGTICFI